MPRELQAIATRYSRVEVNGIDVFYREAGPKDARTILMLHGFPSSSHMFRDLIPLLADCYHLVAPDYPGFGFSAAPKLGEFDYTFDAVADLIRDFTDAIGLFDYALYMHDFGGPVGFRLAVLRPERIRGFIVQNANAYEEGIGETMRRVVLPLWPHATPETEMRARTGFELPMTKKQFLEGVPDPGLVSPDAWQHAQWGLDRTGVKDIAFALQADYGSNIESYDEWHAYFREHQPPTLVVWGQGDVVFTIAGAQAYRRDLKNIEIQQLDTGHFALETHAPQIAWHIVDFLGRHAW
jgi:pimeloyl-ACP methyl ester carboxylesterase